MDTVTLKVIRIDLCPTGADHQTKEVQPLYIPPGNEYASEYQELRTDLKSLNVIQPQGTSFKVTKSGETGEVIEWQKWSFRVGFNQREGMVLYDVSFDLVSYFRTNAYSHRSDMMGEVCSIGSRFLI